jgi:hypothetical protein
MQGRQLMVYAALMIIGVMNHDPVEAATLTQAQKTAFKNAISGDPAIASCLFVNNFQCIADYYNQQSSPDWWVYKTRLSRTEVVQETSVDGTVFNWTGAGFITRSQGERDAWRELWNSELAVNPSLANVRQAFLDIFSGATQPAPANRTHLAAMARRLASRFEKLFSTGVGSSASPATMTVEGPVSALDVDRALVEG